MHGSSKYIQTYTGKFILLFSLILICVFSKNNLSEGKSDKPAKVNNGVKESELTTVILSPTAEQRLGVETTVADYQIIRNTLRLGGEIMSLPGHQARIAAPMAGTVYGINSDELLPAGTQVKKGQAILNLLLLTPEKDIAGVREAVEVKKVQLEVAQAQADRAKLLLQDKATSRKIYLEAQAGLAAARASLKAAEARLHLLDGTGMESATEGLSTFVLKSPVDGVIQRIHVAPGQAVSASTLLFEVVSQDPVWVRVPVYVGDMVTVDQEKDAIIQPLGNVRNKNVYNAKPVNGPLLSDPNSVSSDLFFEISNPDGLFRTGQKVSVSLTKLGSGNRIAVPWSAIMYDIHGGSWVYLKTARYTYSRQRVEVSGVIDGYAVVTRGVNKDDEIVITAVTELFGTEFGGGK
ncbi:efflux transporter, RND family, MFP subunit [Candidatus Scalindua japonica]|uniref:Efflux transporter, RND family, MFP subunit n=1 Tax=Candidatus Scalindua japonica TaxID=1284222 RepID=A0A286TWJ8_9BACT|nr:efflux RND transporter periplasmic adaptor subunit [Candidatus Scalindua japonica]GAX60267.1 efflux transporter, RND family, MFP subunit [Candidatus Scalindua japonica]